MLRRPVYTSLATLLAIFGLPVSASAGTVRIEYVVAVPASASARTLGIESVASPSSEPGWRLVFTATPSEANRVSFSAVGTAVVIRDAGASVVAGLGCTQLAPNDASCATPDGSAFTDATADLGDADDSAHLEQTFVHGWLIRGDEGNDSLDARSGFGAQTVRIGLAGGRGADRLAGAGEGPAALSGGGGNDLFDHPGKRDRVDCGAGRDLVDLEDSDPGAARLGVVGPLLPRGCERIQLTSFGFRLPVVRAGVARTRVNAPEPYGGRCGAGLELRSRGGALLGRKRWRSTSDVDRSVTIRLNTRGDRLVRRHAPLVVNQLRYIGGIPGNSWAGLGCFDEGFQVDGARVRL